MGALRERRAPIEVLGGNTAALPAGVSLSMLNDVMTRINENFDNGTTNNGFLVP